MGRRDQTITQERVDELNRVRGWIQPVFTHEDPVTGRRHRLITQEDGEKIALGYACGECGAVYDMVMAACVVCHKPIALELAPARPEWGQHLADRESGYTAPIAQNPFAPGTADAAIWDIQNDPDVEHRKL